MLVAQAQRQWDTAKEYLLKDLEISLEFKDEYCAGITLRTLARLWQESGDQSLPAAVAPYLGATAEQVTERFKRALEPGGEG